MPVLAGAACALSPHATTLAGELCGGQAANRADRNSSISHGLLTPNRVLATSLEVRDPGDGTAPDHRKERPKTAAISPSILPRLPGEFGDSLRSEVIVSWCDKLASTPAVGVRLDKLYAPVSVLLEPLTPIVSTWVEKDRDAPAFTVDHHDPFSCTLQTFDGYSYILGPEQLTVEFRHRLRFRAQSAGPPTAELLTTPRPYTEVLPDVTAKLLKVVELVTAGKARKLVRIGVVSTTLVSEEEVPPGIARFLKHVARPWNTSPDAFNVELTTKLPKPKGSTYQDRCIHLITKPEANEGLVTIKLDWQRFLDEAKGVSMTSLPGLISDAQKAALDYFEDIAQGERFDA